MVKAAKKFHQSKINSSSKQPRLKSLDFSETKKNSSTNFRSFFTSHRFLTILAIIAGLVLGGAIILALSAYLTYRTVVVSPNSPQIPIAKGEPSPTPTPTPDPNRDFGILLMGYGGGGHEGGYLTDTMILAYIQPRNEKITLINIPRDLWVPLPIKENESQHFKINAAYAIGRDDRNYRQKPVQYTGAAGGGEMAKDMVELVSGLNVEHFATLSFAGFIQSIDTLGGVNVRVPMTFDDYFYPIQGKEDDTCGFSEEDIATASAELKGEKLEQFFTCRFEHLHFDAGVQAMDGTSALKFVRSRHSQQSGGDFARSDRQRALILGVKEKVLSINFIPKIWPFLSTLRSEFQTDINAEKAAELAGKADEYQTYDIESLTLSTQNALMNGRSSGGQFTLLPKSGEDNWSAIQEYINSELSDQPATSSATDTKTE